MSTRVHPVRDDHENHAIQRVDSMAGAALRKCSAETVHLSDEGSQSAEVDAVATSLESSLPVLWSMLEADSMAANLSALKVLSVLLTQSSIVNKIPALEAKLYNRILRLICGLETTTSNADGRSSRADASEMTVTDLEPDVAENHADLVVLYALRVLRNLSVSKTHRVEFLRHHCAPLLATLFGLCVHRRFSTSSDGLESPFQPIPSSSSSSGSFDYVGHLREVLRRTSSETSHAIVVVTLGCLRNLSANQEMAIALTKSYVFLASLRHFLRSVGGNCESSSPSAAVSAREDATRQDLGDRLLDFLGNVCAHNDACMELARSSSLRKNGTDFPVYCKVVGEALGSRHPNSALRLLVNVSRLASTHYLVLPFLDAIVRCAFQHSTEAENDSGDAMTELMPRTFAPGSPGSVSSGMPTSFPHSAEETAAMCLYHLKTSGSVWTQMQCRMAVRPHGLSAESPMAMASSKTFAVCEDVPEIVAHLETAKLEPSTAEESSTVCRNGMSDNEISTMKRSFSASRRIIRAGWLGKPDIQTPASMRDTSSTALCDTAESGGLSDPQRFPGGNAKGSDSSAAMTGRSSGAEDDDDDRDGEYGYSPFASSAVSVSVSDTAAAGRVQKAGEMYIPRSIAGFHMRHSLR